MEAPAPRVKRQRAAAAAQTEQRAALTPDRITAERTSNIAAKVQLRIEKADPRGSGLSWTSARRGESAAGGLAPPSYAGRSIPA